MPRKKKTDTKKAYLAKQNFTSRGAITGNLITLKAGQRLLVSDSCPEGDLAHVSSAELIDVEEDNTGDETPTSGASGGEGAVTDRGDVVDAESR